MFKKAIFSVIIAGVLFTPFFSVSAQVDQRCWTEQECINYRLPFVNNDEKIAIDGVYYASEHDDAKKACGGTEDTAGKKLGFCLPAGQTETSISFGGKTKFAHIGEFIVYVQRYGFMAATIIAVFMVVTAGAQWSLSAGNSETITKAKGRISNAIVGLVLLSFSYILLKLLNPYLVNLRLPQIWAINQLGLVPPYCDEMIDTSTTVAFAYKQKDLLTMSDQQRAELLKTAKFEGETGLSAPCGDYYFVYDTGNQTCRGSACESGKVCAPSPAEQAEMVCQDAQLILHLGVGSMWQDTLIDVPLVAYIANVLEDKTNWLDKDVFGLVGACVDSQGKFYPGTFRNGYGNANEAVPLQSSKRETFKPQMFKFPRLIDATQSDAALSSEWCPKDKKLVGFWGYGEIGEKNNGVDDARYWIGMSKDSKQALVGTWDMVGWQNYIPLEKLRRGVYLRVLFNENVINKTLEIENTWPSDNSGSLTIKRVPIEKGN
ncbi:MAG: pilin [Candidatus Magasanikbacteria bacterium]